MPAAGDLMTYGSVIKIDLEKNTFLWRRERNCNRN